MVLEVGGSGCSSAETSAQGRARSWGPDQHSAVELSTLSNTESSFASFYVPDCDVIGESDTSYVEGESRRSLGKRSTGGSSQNVDVEALQQALARKESECEHLHRLLKELVASRSQLVRTKVDLQERFSHLQVEMYRVLKVADLARTVSKQNVGSTARLRVELRDTKDELYRSKKLIACLQDKNRALRKENLELSERMSLLESIHCYDGMHDSSCMREFIFSRQMELY